MKDDVDGDVDWGEGRKERMRRFLERLVGLWEDFGEVGERRMRRREIGGCIELSLLVVKVERCEGSGGSKWWSGVIVEDVRCFVWWSAVQVYCRIEYVSVQCAFCCLWCFVVAILQEHLERSISNCSSLCTVSFYGAFAK